MCIRDRVVPAAKFAGLAASPLLPFGAIPQRLEGKELKLTRPVSYTHLSCGSSHPEVGSGKKPLWEKPL